MGLKGSEGLCCDREIGFEPEIKSISETIKGFRSMEVGSEDGFQKADSCDVS